jgi:hypothetical protein
VIVLSIALSWSRRDRMFIEPRSQRSLKLPRSGTLDLLKDTLRSSGAKEILRRP